jgi:hypothetical protein
MSPTALKEVPRYFGVTRAQVADVPIPERIGDVISLPGIGPTTALYPLLGGEQFVFAQDGLGAGLPRRAFFGGTDEQPFLVELRLPHLATLLAEGEPAFYESLKPDAIKQMEAVFGPQTIRQGDIYAFPIPLNWNVLMRLQPRSERRNGIRRSNGSIEGTRHHLSQGHRARIIRVHIGEDKVRFPWQMMAGDGVLRAPDHAARTLVGPHLIDRSRSMQPSGRLYGD